MDVVCTQASTLPDITNTPKAIFSPSLNQLFTLPQSVKFDFFSLQNTPPSHSLFREKGELKPRKKHGFAPQWVSSSSLFWCKNLHLASNWLASLSAAYDFFTPKTRFLPLEFHFFTAILHLFYTHILSRAKFFAPTPTAFLYILPPI